MESASRQQEIEFEVDYFKWRDLPINQFIGFPAFHFEGLHWALHYYPNYASKSNQFFSLMHLSDARSVSTGASFSLLHKNRTFRATLNNSFHTFNGNSTKYGAMVGINEVEDFMSTEGTFIIVCTIQVFRSTVDISVGGLQGYLGKLLHKSETSDVTFEVEGEKICAHKLILASKSQVFEAAFFGPLAEVDMKCIRIEEMKADVFKAMLNFIYTDRIVSDGSVNVSLMSTEWILDLLAAADRYGIEKLKDICQVMLDENLSVETVLTILALAERYSCLLLKDMCLQFASIRENYVHLVLGDEYLCMMRNYPPSQLNCRQNLLFPCLCGPVRLRQISGIGWSRAFLRNEQSWRSMELMGQIRLLSHVFYSII